jgi:hypothetical protein
MSKERAIKEATEIANKDNIVMVVTFNPFAEFDSEVYGYYPAVAHACVPHEEIIEIIKPEGRK